MLKNLRNALAGPLKGLAGYKQFILWRPVWNEKKKKNDKLPVDYRTGQVATAHDPEAWLDAETALSCAGLLGIGVGFTFTENDPFFFLDIDNALENEAWNELARGLTLALRGAALEKSQSGTGLHVFGRCAKIQHACKNVKLDLELYTEKRFVALTGDSASGNCDLDKTNELTDLVARYFPVSDVVASPSVWTNKPMAKGYGPERADGELLKKSLTVKSVAGVFTGKASFDDLFKCNAEAIAVTFPGNGDRGFDDSSADMALANHLMYFTGGNCEQTKRLMFLSGLKRDKWDDRDKYIDNWTVPKAYNLWASGDREPFLKGRVTAIAPEDRDGSGIGDGLTLGTGHAHYEIGFVDYIKSSNKPKGTYYNFRELLKYKEITAQFNEMTFEAEVNIPGAKFFPGAEQASSASVLKSYAIAVDYPAPVMPEYTDLYALENPYHPVRDWILGTPWDGMPRINRLVDSLHAKNHELAEQLVKKWIIGAIEAVFNDDGVVASGILVLQGPQYSGKTRWIKALGGDQSKRFIKSGKLLDPSNRDSVKQITRYWIAELGELEGTFKKSDIAALKNFITDDVDEFRGAYDRHETRKVRRTVFCASVNPKEYLNDDTGNRRYWTIEVDESIDDNHGIDMQQLWAEAREIHLAGAVSYISREEHALLDQYNRGFETSSIEEELFTARYDVASPRVRLLTIPDIATEIGLDIQRVNSRKINQMISRQLGVNGPRKSNGQRVFDMPVLRSALSGGAKVMLLK